MQVADNGYGIADHLAIQLQDHPQYPVGGWVLGAHVQDHLPLAGNLLRHLGKGIRRYGRHLIAIEILPFYWEIFAQGMTLVPIPGQ